MPLSKTTYGYVVDPLLAFTDDKGMTISNGYIKVFLAGTSTGAVTYANYEGATNEEEIQLDNSGRCASLVIASNEHLYKVCVYDRKHSQENPIRVVDDVSVAIYSGDFVESTNVDPGIYTKVTVNKDGLVTDGGPLEDSDIPSLPAEKLTSGTLDPDRIGEKSIDNSKLADGSVDARTIDITAARNLIAGSGVKIEVDNLDVTVSSAQEEVIVPFETVNVTATYPQTTLNIEAGKSYQIALDADESAVELVLSTDETATTLHTRVSVSHSGEGSQDVTVKYTDEFGVGNTHSESMVGSSYYDIYVDIRKVNNTPIARVFKCL